MLDNLPGLVGSLVTSPATSSSPSSRDSQKRPLLLPEVEEIRVSPIISKKGHLNVLDHKTKVVLEIILLLVKLIILDIGLEKTLGCGTKAVRLSFP